MLHRSPSMFPQKMRSPYSWSLIISMLAAGVLLSIFVPKAHAQDDLMQTLEEETQDDEQVNYISATFKDNRVINGHSVETPSGGVLQFVISHRFGRLNTGIDEFFGLDNATIHFRLKYSPTDRFTVGAGRSSFENTYDGYLKYRLLWQSKGKRNMPISLTLFSDIGINTGEFDNPERDNQFTSRVFYSYQALIARKFNRWFSMQLSPTLVHRNLVPQEEDQNDVFALGVAGRVRLTGSITLNAEYFYVPDGQIVSDLDGQEVEEAISVGFDIETGGHVFQLHFTNSRGMITKKFATETTGRWFDGDIHFGFNISRVFTLQKDHPHHKKWGW